MCTVPAPRPSRSPVRRALAGIGLALGLTLTGTTPAVGGVPDTPPTTEPAPPVPMDAASDTGPQRWVPPLAGSAHAVAVGDGTARLDPARDGEDAPASLRGAQRQGLLDLGPHRFGAEVNRIAVPLTADVPPGSGVEVDVRGQGPDGQWSEWAPSRPAAPAVLTEPTRTVAVRLVLTAGPGGTGPTVRGLEVLADRVATPPEVVAPRASYRVFATREGLVGGTTANGHKIRPNDQFVALPSRRALSPRGRGDYSVRICTDARRCATVPVWDVGPWNTTDDYWNPAGTRQRWKELPMGVPQAQAAFNDRFNGGRDGFGRVVKNPAGIDLGDGTFSGLGLKTNSWVTVEYLWTAPSPAIGQAVAPGGPIPLRSQPTEAVGDVGVIGDGAQVDVECQVAGAPVAGHQGVNNLWLRVAPGQYVPAAFVTGAPPLPPCAG